MRDDLRWQMLKLAGELLAKVSGSIPPTFTVRITTPERLMDLAFTTLDREMDQDDTADLTEIQQAIIRVASPCEPRQAKHLARLSGYSINSYFRATLAEMVRANLLRHTPDGYLLPLDQAMMDEPEAGGES